MRTLTHTHTHTHTHASAQKGQGILGLLKTEPVSSLLFPVERGIPEVWPFLDC